MEAKKFIEKKVEGEYEFIKNHKIDVTEKLDLEDMVERFNLYDEDDETAYLNYGICFDENGDIFCIGVDKFISGMRELLNDNENQDYWRIEKEIQEEFEEQLKLLEKYKGYDIYL